MPDEIDELTQKLSELRAQQDKLLVNADAHADRRNKLNEQFKSLRSEIAEMRDERDRLNAEVKELKQKRSDINARFHEKIEEVRKLRQELRLLFKKEPPKSFGSLQEEFDSIEWKIQTESLDLAEEKRLVEHAMEIEKQLNVHKKVDRFDKRILQMQADINALQVEGKASHDKLTEMAKKSQEIHANMVSKIEQSKKLKAEADGLHQLFVQAKEQIKPVQDQIVVVVARLKQLKVEIREEVERERNKDEAAIREELEKNAREKMKRGEKLSWEEFQILAEKGMEAQD